MRNNLLYSFIFTFLLVALGSAAVTALQGPDDGLSLDSPAACPSSGCAAGQRLNFTVDFSVNPQNSTDPNTQVCVYTPDDGQEGSGNESWADFSQGWIAENNADPGYTTGESGSVCSDAVPADHEFLAGAYATHTIAKNEQIEFVLQINETTDLDGNVRVKIFEVDSSGTNWDETTDSISAFTVSIPVTPIAQTAYAAEHPDNCGSFSPCFVHSGDDGSDGLGTGLHDAIQVLNPGGEIIILKDMRIKTNPVLIDKNLTIKGYDQESMLTSIVAENACSNHMLEYKSAGVLRNLTLNDGNCPASNSRTLVAIDSPGKVTIKNNTLDSGKVGIHVRNNLGTVDIAFNEITNHQAEAVLIDTGSTDSDRANIYANNIINNGSGVQVNCNSGESANHNFWGEGEVPADNTANCSISPGKELGAPILAASDGHGVQAILRTVNGAFNYYFNGKVGVRHTDGDDFDIVIVNHGQGKDVNIPFYESGSGDIVPCGNFYDIFLAKYADSKNLEIALKYDLNNYCIEVIESDFYCGNQSQTRFPLWWYDPVNKVTEGWDRTGQAPIQATTCNTLQDEIIVKIDNTGRPGLSNLFFTPFTTGYIDGSSLTDFTAAFTNYYTKISWQTAMEKNLKRYEVLKSGKKEGTYKVIAEVDVDEDSNTASTYQFYDYHVDLSTTYFYKLQVIYNNDADEIIGLHGPITVNIPGPTVTNTPTITRTPYPTLTPRYRTPTRAYYRSATPAGAPTAVRTFGPSPTGPTKPAFVASPTSTITPLSGSGYPSGDNPTPTDSAYPISEDQTITPTQVTIGSQGTTSQPAGDTNGNRQDADQQNGVTNQTPARAVHFMIGLGTGLAVLLGVSLTIVKSLFN